MTTYVIILMTPGRPSYNPVIRKLVSARAHICGVTTVVCSRHCVDKSGKRVKSSAICVNLWTSPWMLPARLECKMSRSLLCKNTNIFLSFCTVIVKKLSSAFVLICKTFDYVCTCIISWSPVSHKLTVSCFESSIFCIAGLWLFSQVCFEMLFTCIFGAY